jgi:Mn2+/Fe2+ NRAMP family transporter
MFFWQSGHRIEEMREEGNGPLAEPLDRRPRKQSLRKLISSRVDVLVGMLASTVAMFAIMVATASTIGRDGPQQLSTAADAAKALEPIAGPFAAAIFAIGFIVTGVLAVPVLASSGSIALAGLLGKPWGFNRSTRNAPLFYGIIGVGLIGGVAISAFTDNPVQLLVLSATINGIAAAPFLLVVMLLSRDPQLMGTHANGKLAAVVGWTTTAIMLVAGVVGIWATIASR